MGAQLEELRAIIDRVELTDKLGVCLDTCHISDGGYDIVNDLDGVLEEFDKVIGLGRLKAVHLNDSMNPLGSHKDRHQKLGEGTLGLDALTRIINHPALRDLPFYLEDPQRFGGVRPGDCHDERSLSGINKWLRPFLEGFSHFFSLWTMVE